MNFQSLMNIAKCLAASAVLLAFTGSALADTYPSKPVRIIVHAAAGGALDSTVRFVAPHLSEVLGQSVVVENRPGAGGLIGIRYVKSAPADGYTLLATAASFALLPELTKEPGYDPITDFVTVSPMVQASLIPMSSTSLPYKNIADLIAAARANPNKLTFASAGIGSSTHLAAEKFQRQAGIQMTHVPYKGNGAAIPDVIAGRVDVFFDSLGSSGSNVKAGRLRALGVTMPQRITALPDVPTIAEQGVPGYAFVNWYGVVAPLGTPKDVVQRLNDAFKIVLSRKPVTDRIREGGDEPMYLPTAEFDAFLKNEVVGANKLISALGLPKE